MISGAFSFTPQSFAVKAIGLLFSPSRGLLVYSPILIFAIFGFFSLCKRWRCKDEKLLLCLVPGCIILVIQYSCFSAWWGGGSYGPRFLTDSLTVLCFIINYAIAEHLKSFSSLKQSLVNWRTFVFSALLAFSVFAQAVGAFGSQGWNGIPLDIDANSAQFPSGWRLWHVADTEIERNARSIFTQITQPAKQPGYVEGLRGKILQIRNINRQPMPPQISVKPDSIMILKAAVQNTGTSQWLGYQTAAYGNGEMRVKVLTVNSRNQVVSEQPLFISGEPRGQETASALGGITFPRKSGSYKLRFSLFAQGLQEVSDNVNYQQNPSALDLKVNVEP